MNLEHVTLQAGEVLVVGLYSTIRDGKSSNTVSYLRPFEDWQAERGTVSGLCAETEFTRMDCSGLHVGDVARLIYQKGFKGKAELAGYTVTRRISGAKE